MRAAIFEKFLGPIEVAEVPDPSPPLDGVVIKVEANGICRSDWHGWMGHDPCVKLPHVPGHELAGHVVATGPRTRSIEVGDRVVSPFILSCGVCDECLDHQEQVCDDQYQPGFTGFGGFAEYVAVPRADGNLVVLPEDVAFTTAAGLGCRFATAFRAVVDQGAVTVDSRVAVWGCGGVGLSVVMIAAALGAEVTAVDVDPVALSLAEKVGAAHSVLVEGHLDTVEVVREISGGGVDVSFDTLGSPTTCIASIRSLKKRGRHVQVGLLVGEEATPNIPMGRLHADEIELFGSHGMPAWRYPAMFEMIQSGMLSPRDLVTATMSLSEGAVHLTQMASFPGSGFVVIDDFTK